FAPAQLDEALATYRATFRPSQWLAKPYAMLAAGVCAADSDEEASYLRSSQVLSFARLRTGKAGKLPLPVRDLSEVPAAVMAQVDHALSCSAIGSPQTVREALGGLVKRHQPDEIMITAMIHDNDARLHSLEIAAKALEEIRQ